ncbi:KIF-binding protein-like [Mya arenaria]|uniref:KIF-binding protein-like n=1 Tax=Mya arenaria TaxID=6604 RepID=UPI0022E8DB4E|nr:KIF-binding protein-like [Mya arenaria]
MASWKDILENEGYNQLIEAKKYTEELAKDDPEDEPYRSLYHARGIYKSVHKLIKKTADKHHWDEDFYFVWSALELKLGINYVSTEEKSTGEEHLQKCLDKMEDFKLTKEGMGIYQEALNQMGILQSGRGKPEEALDCFKQAELLYVDFKDIVGGAPCSVDEYLSPKVEDTSQLELERTKKFESAYTHTLFYFAQVYQQLGEADISGQYCHLTLQRQLDSPGLDPLDWCLHAATLSQYYMTNRDFTISRHCLASAEVVYAQAEANDEVNCPDEEKEKLHQAKADIVRCWIKYGLGLMEYSREELLNEAAGKTKDDMDIDENADENKNENVDTDKESNQSENASDERGASSCSRVSNKATENQDDDQAKEKSNDNESIEEQETSANQAENTEAAAPNSIDVKNSDEKNGQLGDEDPEKIAERLKHQKEEISKRSNELRKNAFKKGGKRFNLEVTSHEEKITDKTLKTFDEAREIFLLVKKWIDGAKEFYKFEHHCTDYVSIVQDHSLSFKFLSFFEPDLERQCKMHKRRIDMLTEILNELNPQHYLLVCRQLMFEIADTYSAMMDLKIAILEAAGGTVRPTPHHVKKINILVSESIKYYQEYLNTLKGGKPVYPDEFPINDVRPGLVAMFCMGRLYSKFLAGDVQTRLLNMKKSKDCYQFVVDYCKKNPSAKPLVETEADICQEMVELLPAKMERVRLQAEM